MPDHIALMTAPPLVTSAEVRATTQALSADVEARILAVLAERGEASTLDLVRLVESQRGSRRDLIESLASLLDQGEIVGTRKPHGRSDSLAGITWRPADV